MKAKVFHLRLTKENLQNDQDKLNEFLDGVVVDNVKTELIQSQPNFRSVLVFYDVQIAEQIDKKAPKSIGIIESDLTPDELKVYKVLKEWRYDLANEINVPIYFICHNSELMSIAKLKPQTQDELEKIKGFGKRKVAKYGDDILAVLKAIHSGHL